MAVAIMGPTASGKTAAALAIAREMPVEIISVDSALVYRGMDIGTAKPTAEELASVPHHLIDIIDPLESYSVMQFREDAIQLVAEIQARLFELLPNPPLTTGQVQLLKADNVASGALPGFRELKIELKTVEEVVPTYIGMREPGSH